MPKISFQSAYTKRQVSSALIPRFLGELKIYLVYLVFTSLIVTGLYSFVKYYAFTPVGITGESMYPYHQTGDRIYVDLFTSHFGNYRRGEVVVLEAPRECDTKEELFIKRVIGLPGETISFENGEVFVLNKSFSNNPIKLDERAYLPTQTKTYKNISQPDSSNPGIEAKSTEKELGPDEYFFMGDNRVASLDGRRCGPIKKSQIIGKEFYRWQPEEKRGYFNIPKYNLPSE